MSGNPLAPGLDRESLPVVLLVDDSDGVRRAAGRILRSHFRVVEASSGRAALEIIAGGADEIALVLLDVEMPDLDGRQTFDEIARLSPDVLPRIRVMSGGPRDPALAAWCASLGPRFVDKATLAASLRALASEFGKK